MVSVSCHLPALRSTCWFIYQTERWSWTLRKPSDKQVSETVNMKKLPNVWCWFMLNSDRNWADRTIEDVFWSFTAVGAALKLQYSHEKVIRTLKATVLGAVKVPVRTSDTLNLYVSCVSYQRLRQTVVWDHVSWKTEYCNETCWWTKPGEPWTTSPSGLCAQT